ncbi:MAG: hypothetical protein FJ146_04895 [Deltaproteobacteria bacterium]|nr:hypothetical protein [Deltaproteobacteria bacterium]
MAKLIALIILGNIIVTGIYLGQRQSTISGTTCLKVGSYFFLSFVALAYFLRLVPEWIEPRL